MSKLYMFSTVHCTKCPEVKEALSKKDVEVEYIDAEETPELAMIYLVMSVPTIVDKVKEALSKKDIEVEYIDAEETLELAMRYLVMSVPTIVDIDDDKTYWGQEQCLAFVNTL